MTLRRAPAAELKAGRVSRHDGHIVIAMQFYPRFIPSTLRDEYCHELAPERGLFAEFKAAERRLGDHDRAFAEVRYEARFWPGKDGRATLSRLAGQAMKDEVILICQCRLDQRCHVDLLLLFARRLHGVASPPLAAEYPVFAQRVEEWARVL